MAAAAASDETLMASDRAWILVGLLLRLGRSSPPSVLCDRFRSLGFSPSEIQWLCSLPFSPLSLCSDGNVTFSPPLFDVFESSKRRYAPPSPLFLLRGYSTLPARFREEFGLPLPKTLPFAPSSSSSETHDDAPESRIISYGVQQREPSISRNALSEMDHSTRKRCIHGTLVSPRKKANVSMATEEASSLKRFSNVADMEVEDSNDSSLSSDAKKAFKLSAKLERKQSQDKTKQFHAQKPSPAASLVDVKIQLHPLASTFPIPLNRSIIANESYSMTKSRAPDSVDDKSIIHGSIITETVDNLALDMVQKRVHNVFGGKRLNTSVLSADGNLMRNIICTESSINTLKDSIDHSMNQEYKLEIAVEKLDVIDADGPARLQNAKEIKMNSKSAKLIQKVENVKQPSKLGKRKKPSSHPRSQETGLAHSPVMETCSNQLIDEKLPSFEGFIVEAIEGSGGYGTVYKAMCKADGKLRAIKYPYEKTSSKYVKNEINVLQKYGGHSYIPRCVDVIEESGRQCLILEYVEHEKPEVLKKEITISELRAYGFSLFKALEYLHSKGVIHRDVKPGNFLYSRERGNGWLVDFNLATVQQKQVSSVGREKQSVPKYGSRTKTLHRETGNIQDKTSTPSTPMCNTNLSSRLTNSSTSEAHNYIESTPNHQRKKLHCPDVSLDSPAHGFPKFSSARSSPASGQGFLAKGTASGLKGSSPNMQWSPLRQQQAGETQKCEQMIPRFGRRELWEFVQKNQRSPQSPVSALPSSYKKRVAAPQKRKHQKALVDASLLQSTAPLPISRLSNVKTTESAHLSKVRVIQKMRKEGPCAGTKGYRAPEVLLKSPYQNEKIDIWSAGVSLLQLLLGKSPFSFSSNVEQSLLDISQFSGSDAICRLAKEHNREATLPKEVSSSKLEPTSVQDWCEKNIKRSDILPLVPPSLFHLLERCLQIDPRDRISAKEAVRHEFFSSCQKTGL